ncbi:MAG: putative ABC transporter permease subunit [Bacteroidota bacterium]
MHELLLLLNIKSTSFLKGIFEWKWQTMLKNISSACIFGGFAVGVFFLTRFFTNYLLYEAHIGQFLFHRFLSMLLYVFFITVNLGNMIVSYSTLYKSQEVNFLMSMPISHAKVFLVKFIDNFFYSSSTLSLVGLSVLLGYGSVFGMPWYFYFFTAFFIMMPFMLIAGILAVMVLMSLIKIATKIGAKWLIGIMVTGYVTAIYLYFRIVNPVGLVQEVMRHYPDVNEYFGYLDPPFVQYLPNHWITEFLYWSINGDAARAIPYFTLLFLTMLGLIVLASIMAKRVYYPTWLAASDADAMKGPKASLRVKGMEFGTRWFIPPQLEVLLKRDFWMFLREPSQWLHLGLMMLLLLIFLVSVASLELKLTQPFMQAVSFLVVFLFNGFLIASVSLRFVFPTTSLEGDTFWTVRTSPLSLHKLYWYKFLGSFLFVLIVAELLSVASILLLSGNMVLVQLAAICTFFVTVGLISMNLGAGTYFAVFKEKNPIRVASSQGASLTFLGSMVYLTLVVTVLVVPLNEYFTKLIRFGVSQTSWIFIPVLVIGVFSMVMFASFTIIGLKAIKRDY